jgi:hypothetical protein
MLVVGMVGLFAGCGGSPSFATGCNYDDNPQQAASKAAADAIAKLKGKPVKGLVFAVYYEKASFTAKEPGEYMPDTERERIAAETIAKIAKELAVKQELGERPTDEKQYPVTPPVAKAPEAAPLPTSAPKPIDIDEPASAPAAETESTDEPTSAPTTEESVATSEPTSAPATEDVDSNTAIEPIVAPTSAPAVATTKPVDKAAAAKAAKEAEKAAREADKAAKEAARIAARAAARKAAEEKAAAERVAEARAMADKIAKIQPLPNIGLRSKAFVDGHEMQPNSVAVLAIAGDVECTAVKLPIQDDRGKTGQMLANSVRKMENLKLVFVFSEMTLNFAPGLQGKAQSFIDRALAGMPKDAILFGGNSMNDPSNKDNILAGGQYFNGQPADGSIVAMAVAGNMKVFVGQANEFTPVPRTVLVTESRGPWVISLDDRPAEEVYRRLAEMTPEEKFTSDWQNPIGIPVARNKLYIQMVTNWIDKDGKDKDGKSLPLPAGSLRFRSDIPFGTQICVLTGGNDPDKILTSLRDCTKNALEQADDKGYVPSLILVCECCARNMRLEAMRSSPSQNSASTVTRLSGKYSPAVFGFYAFGHFAPIGGTFMKSSTHFQQHVVTSIVVAE